MMKKIVTFLLLWMSISVMARTVSGVVVDENSAPLGFVSVALLCDSTVVDATVSDADSGSFSFSNASANRLRLSMVGYEDFLMAIPADGQCGTVAMTPSTTLLGEVVVRDRLPQTRLSGNGLVTKIEGSVLETVGTANDVLARLPLVSMENDQVSVLGHGSPIIYINGRQVRSDNELQQLSSENIRSIEVITNPGARYDASVRSVIRIRTKRAPGEGFGFEFYHNTHAKHYVRSTDALNMHFTEGPLQLFAEGYVAYGKSYWGANMDQTTFADHIYTQHLTERTPSRTNYYTGKLGFDYLIGNHSFGAYYKYENGHTHGNGQYNSSIWRDDVHIEDVSSTVAARNLTVPVHSVNAYYNGAVGQLQIDFNSDLFLSSNTDVSNRENVSSISGFSSSFTSNATDKRLVAEKLVLTYPLWRGQVEVGQEFTHSRLGYDVTNLGIDVPSSFTTIYENAATAFASLSQQLGSANVTAGVRYEHLNNRVTENGVVAGGSSRVYNDFFPSLSISAPVRNVNLSLSFSGKIDRPSYEQLDGSLQYVDQFTYKHGNPLLRSTKVWEVQSMAMWRIFLAMLSYTHQKDPVYYDCTAKADDPTVRVISYSNMRPDNQVLFFAGAQPTLGRWTNNISAGFLYYHYRTTFNGQEMLFNHPIYIFKINSSLRLPCDWALTLDYQVQSAGTYQNVKVRPMNYLEFQVQKHLFNKSLTLSLDATDILNRGTDNRPTLYAGNIITYCENMNFSRGVTFSLTYRFNAARKKYRGTGAGTDARNRM